MTIPTRTVAMETASRSRAAEPAAPPGVIAVLETRGEVGWTHPGWAAAWPWLAQGTTGIDAPGDMGFFGTTPVGETLARWRLLRERTGIGRAVHARQVHGCRILTHAPGRGGTEVLDDADGHVAARSGVLLTVSVADCVPVSLVDPRTRRIALLHAGWRGTAAGILEAGLAALARLGSPAAALHVHLGPAICGPCYEVGADVLAAIGSAAAAPARLDLRALLATRAVRGGVAPARITRSAHCTRCGDRFFSHRGGQTARQVGFLGIREGS